MTEAKEIPLEALLDSGAINNFIDESLVDRLGLSQEPLQFRQTMYLADGSKAKAGQIKDVIRATLLLGEGLEPYSSVFSITPILVAPIVLGIPFLQEVNEVNPRIDWERRCILPSNGSPTQQLWIVKVCASTIAYDPDFLTHGGMVMLNATNADGERTIEQCVPQEYHKFLDVFSKSKSNGRCGGSLSTPIVSISLDL